MRVIQLCILAGPQQMWYHHNCEVEILVLVQQDWDSVEYYLLNKYFTIYPHYRLRAQERVRKVQDSQISC